MLLRVRTPEQYTAHLDARVLDREEWLLQRFDGSIDRLTRDAESPQRVAADKWNRRVAAARAAELELEALLHDRRAEGESEDSIQATFAALQAKRDQWIARRNEAAPDGGSTEPSPDAARWSSVRFAPADKTAYFLSEQVPDAFHLDASAPPAADAMSTSRWVRWLTAALAGLILVVPRLAAEKQKYWPAAVFAAGLAWLYWCDATVVGVGLLLLSAAGVFLTVRSWYSLSPLPLPVDDGAANTVLFSPDAAERPS